MSNDLTPPIELLRSTEVVALSVDEIASLHSLDCHRDGECRVRRSNVTHVGGELELARRLSGLGGDVTHGDGVARATLYLQAIGDGLAHTEVDEVVR